jgi:hypothetical protein
MAKFDVVQIIAGDKKQISYRPILNHITGGLEQTILLQQIIFRWENAGKKPFYKFKEECDHRLYVNGDSWCEELGFSRRQFDRALNGTEVQKGIGFKIKKKKAGEPYQPKKRDVFVYYWTDRNRLTYYEINESYLSKKLLEIYGAK